jgi:hypothetical protein
MNSTRNFHSECRFTVILTWLRFAVFASTLQAVADEEGSGALESVSGAAGAGDGAR